MSHNFVARFDMVDLTLEQLLTRLADVMAAHRLTFTGFVRRQVEHKGWPVPETDSLKSVEDFEGTQVGTLEAIPRVAKKWWGVSLSCVSGTIVDYLGRGDAMEVDIVLYQPRVGTWSILYLESSTVQEVRLEEEAFATELYSLQLAFARQIGFTYSIYDEQILRGSPIVSIEEVRSRLRAADSGALGCSIVVATQTMSMDEARAEAGAHRDLVRQAPGYLLFEYLLPDA